jgi:hypothetical protein
MWATVEDDAAAVHGGAEESVETMVCSACADVWRCIAAADAVSPCAWCSGSTPRVGVQRCSSSGVRWQGLAASRPGDRRGHAQSCARVCVRVRVRVQSQAADVEAQFRHLLQEVARARACSDEVRVRAGSAQCSVP